MKMGILAMLRRRLHIKYQTNGENWIWRFACDKKTDEVKLAIVIRKTPVEKAKVDLRVEISRIESTDIAFDNFLWLVTPHANEFFGTPHGSIMVGDQYCNKIYHKGIWVEDRKEEPHLHYGVNFEYGTLDRDRRHISESHKLAQRVCRIWDAAISSGKMDAASRYLSLISPQNERTDDEPEEQGIQCIEILRAQDILSKDSAEILLRLLRGIIPDAIFYTGNNEEVFPYEANGLRG
jgi:hypothetical protein